MSNKTDSTSESFNTPISSSLDILLGVPTATGNRFSLQNSLCSLSFMCLENSFATARKQAMVWRVWPMSTQLGQTYLDNEFPIKILTGLRLV